MQKLKNSILAKMIAAHLTSKEIDFLIYVSRFQDDNGCVSGVHYKEVCENMHMSYQGFYDVKNSLIEKGFIKCEKSNRIDHDITILNNAFLSEDDIRSGYINTNHNIFFNEEFFALKAGAKLLAMEIMKLSYAGTGECRIGTTKFYEKYTKLFGVSKRVMRVYLMALKPFFSIGIKDGIYYMRPKRNVYREMRQASENQNFAEHNVEVICRRNKIKEMTVKEKKDVCTLIGQYRRIALEAHKDIIEALSRAIERSLEVLNINEARIIKRVLKPKLIHKLLQEELAVA